MVVILGGTPNDTCIYFIWILGSDRYGGTYNGKVTNNGNTIIWYTTGTGDMRQFNEAGRTYDTLAIS